MFKGIFVTLLLVSLKQGHLTKCKFIVNLWTLCFKFKKVPQNILKPEGPEMLLHWKTYDFSDYW